MGGRGGGGGGEGGGDREGCEEGGEGRLMRRSLQTASQGLGVFSSSDLSDFCPDAVRMDQRLLKRSKRLRIR